MFSLQLYDKWYELVTLYKYRGLLPLWLIMYLYMCSCLWVVVKQLCGLQLSFVSQNPLHVNRAIIILSPLYDLTMYGQQANFIVSTVIFTSEKYHNIYIYIYRYMIYNISIPYLSTWLMCIKCIVYCYPLSVCYNMEIEVVIIVVTTVRVVVELHSTRNGN